jgi:hypothetical protein
MKKMFRVSVPSLKGSFTMTACKIVKKSSVKGSSPLAKATVAAPAIAFQILDNQDDTFTVQGTNAAGDALDISTVATLTASSDNPAVGTVDAPVGMVVTGHFLTAGSTNLTFVATWNDKSTGPFTITLPVTVSGSAATGITVTPGVPTVRP